MDLKSKFRHVYDFPKPGIDFIDITTVLKDPEAFHQAIQETLDLVAHLDYDLIVGSESRGFIVGAPLAFAAKKGFIPIRKPGKLPAETVKVSYALEYGEDSLEMHRDAIQPGQKVLVVDDLLATGGTAKANCQLVEKLGGEIAACLFLVELKDLHGRDKLEGYNVLSVVEF